MDWFAKGLALAGFAALIIFMAVLYEGIEKEPVVMHVDRGASDGSPDSWATNRHDEIPNITEARYAIDYEDCTLYMSKDGSGAWNEIITTVMTCAREPDADPDDKGPDFAAMWEGMGSCDVSSYEIVGKERDGDIVHISIYTICRN